MKEDLAGMADLAGESPATATLTGGRRQAALGFIFVVALLDVVSLGIMIPVLPNLIKEFAGGDTATASSINVLFAVAWAADIAAFAEAAGRPDLTVTAVDGAAVTIAVTAKDSLGEHISGTATVVSAVSQSSRCVIPGLRISVLCET